METLRDNEEKVLCPYNSAHYIRKYRMDVHLKKCRKSYKESEKIVVCDFNAAHRIPEPEIQYHHDICKYRKSVELHVFAEDKIPPIASALPAIPVPIDGSWDDDEVPTYNPQKYCQENAILRRLDTESAAVRRDFRVSERHRFNNLNPVENEARGRAAQSKKATKRNVNNQNLPPTPMFSQNNVENAPLEITRMMERVSVIPKAAIIPKQNNFPIHVLYKCEAKWIKALSTNFQ